MITNYLYRVKKFTQDTIKENLDIKKDIEEEYYKLLIKIAKEEYSATDLRQYYFKIQNLKNKSK